MLSTRKKMTVGLGLAAVAGACGLIAGLQPTDGAELPPHTISSSGYMVEMSLKEQFDFKGSSLAFKGVVTNVLEPRHVQVSGIEYVYTPVEVTVSKMFRGKKPADGKILLRVLGGTADNVRFEADYAPSEEITNAGVELIAIGPDPVVVPGDGLMAMTPNGVHVVDGSELVDVSHSPHHTGHEERRVPLAQAEAALGVR
jgi:hypothetical protein